MRSNLGPCKLIWHHTNKQQAFEFMADEVVLAVDQETRQVRFDAGLVKQLLCREPKPGDMVLEYAGTTAMVLECEFSNPDYGKQIAARFIKRLQKSWGPQRMLLVPNYGLATKAQSFEFWRAMPFLVTHMQILFHLLPTDHGDCLRRGL
jgi:hypothetical protein